MKSKKTFDAFLRTLKTTIRDWKYWTNYQGVIEKFNRFEDLNNRLGTCNKDEFIERFKKAINFNKDFLLCTPIFSGIRNANFSLIEDGKELDFNWKNISINEAQIFLEKVGFMKVFDKFEKVNFPSYFFGVEVGLDSNGRKNRGGKLMEKFVTDKLTEFGLNPIHEIKFSNLSKRYGIEITKDIAKDKKFDSSFIYEGTLYLVETNFFNSGGSKINETLRSFKQLQKEVNNYKSSIPIKFIYITDGVKLMSDKNGLKDTYDAIEYIYNIDDIENGIL